MKSCNKHWQLCFGIIYIFFLYKWWYLFLLYSFLFIFFLNDLYEGHEFNKRKLFIIDSLFDDDNEDDLFAPKEKKVPAKQETKPDVLSAAPKMDSKPVEDKPEELPAPVKKKPPGAVSMFGGMDPFGANKKKTGVQNDKGLF